MRRYPIAAILTISLTLAVFTCPAVDADKNGSRDLNRSKHAAWNFDVSEQALAREVIPVRKKKSGPGRVWEETIVIELERQRNPGGIGSGEIPPIDEPPPLPPTELTPPGSRGIPDPDPETPPTLGSLGLTTWDSGAIQVGNGGVSGSLGSGNVIYNGTLIFSRSDTVVISNQISGNGALTLAGSGTTLLTLSGTTTLLNNGTLQIGNGATTGTLGSGNITNYDGLTFIRIDNPLVASVGTVQLAGSTTEISRTVPSVDAAPVPEPVTWGLAILAGGLLALGRRSTRHA